MHDNPTTSTLLLERPNLKFSGQATGMIGVLCSVLVIFLTRVVLVGNAFLLCILVAKRSFKIRLSSERLKSVVSPVVHPTRPLCMGCVG